MLEPTHAPLDHWADWLCVGRQRGIHQAHASRWPDDGYEPLRDRVLWGARLQCGQRVLDVGAGLGLLALETRRRVGPTGEVWALDVSHDALRLCREHAMQGDPPVPLRVMVADAQALPFADGYFDAVLTRSTLMYVADKARAIHELHRVLKPGGRASVFEPINRVNGYLWEWNVDLGPLQPAHERVLAHLQDADAFHEAVFGFDERDLVHWFVETGFASVNVSYEYGYSAHVPFDQEMAKSHVQLRPLPGLPSYEEAARVVLGVAADEHLDQVVKMLIALRPSGGGAAAYVTAQREGR